MLGAVGYSGHGPVASHKYELGSNHKVEQIPIISDNIPNQKRKDLETGKR